MAPSKTDKPRIKITFILKYKYQCYYVNYLVPSVIENICAICVGPIFPG